MKRLHLIVYLLVCSLGSPALAAEPLVWKFQAGDEHHYRMTQNMDMEMSLGAADRTIETGVQQVIDMTWKVTQLDEQGRAMVSQSIDRLQMDMQAPGQPEMKYDTASDNAPSGFAAMLAPLFKSMTGAPFTMTMSPRGEFDNLKMPEGFINALKAVPGAAMMGEMFDDKGFTNMIQKSSLILPKPQDLSPGHEWTNKSEMKTPQLGTITSELTYRYLGPREVEGKSYEVFSIKMEMDFGAGAGGATIEILNQDSNGEILFDRQVGRLESSKLQQEIDMQVSFAGQVMKQKMLQKVFFQRVDKSPAE